MIVIRLTDDGPGVPDEALDKLFDVFYSALH
jgi:signal transduction histidine kinase